MMNTPLSFFRHIAPALLLGLTSGALVASAAAVEAKRTYPAAALAADQAKRTYNVPAGEATVALRQFSETSGKEVLFAAETLRDVRTPALLGDFTPQEAVGALLKGTGLVAIQDTKTGAFAVRREESPNVPRAAQPVRSVRPERVEDREVVLDKMEVTGTRIRGLVGEANISPVLSITRQEIERAGVTSIGELSRLIPQAYSQGSYDGIGFGGQQTGVTLTSDGSTIGATNVSRSTFNLRGLGTQNTLVLINGRRIAKTGVLNGNDASDLTGIPVSSIERVEVLVGGASAIYGSDAVGGVINLILRRNYSGGELALSYENTLSSDTGGRTATLSYGVTKDKLELQVSMNAQDRNAFAAVDRTFSSTDDWATLGGTTSILTDIGSSFAGGGFATGAGILQSASGGNLPGRTTPFAIIPNNAGTAILPASDYASVAGNVFGVPAYTGDRAKYVNLIAPQRARGASVRANYRLTPHHDFYFETRYSETKTEIEGMPVTYRNAMVAPANYPGNPFGVDVILNKTFWELGPISGSRTAFTANTAIAAGLRGDLALGEWRYDVGFDWNRGELADENSNDGTLNRPLFNTLIASRSLALFYDSRTQRPNDLNVLRSLLQVNNRSEKNTNNNFTASADGSLWDLPAGALRLAVGGEFRAEKASLSQDVPTSNTLRGDFQRDVGAAYAEIRAPIFSDKQQIPLVHSLAISTAARYDSYSDIGGAVSPGYGIIWQPVKGTILRASRNHSFRAPGLQALYRPVTAGTARITSLATSPLDPQRGNTPMPLVTYDTVLGGNLDLKPEKSISDSVGIVIELPGKLFKGFSASADYQVLDYTNRLQVLNLQQLFTYFPQRITRGANLPGDQAGWAGVPTKIDTRAANIANLEVQAIDYQLSYRRNTAWGTIDARMALTDYQKYLAKSVPNAAPTNTLFLYPSRLSWQTYWNKGPYGFGVSGFYQEKQYRNLTYTAVRYASALEWNTQFSYDFDRRTAAPASAKFPAKQWFLAGTKLSLTINNVFDREPPHVEGQAGFAITDPRMARYILSLRKSF